jgi:hypothetical protein
VQPAAASALSSPHARQYRRREPETSTLYAVLQQQLETFLAQAHHHGDGFPRFVERELRAFLKCGILAHGFARVHCPDCHHERLVAFSCKGRGFCPSCCGKRMTRIAEHLVERVMPVVAVRQWVLTVPPGLRYRLAYDHALCTKVLGVFSRALLASYRRRARERGITGGQTGAVTLIQRFGSALNLNVHFHTQVLDGVFTEQPCGTLRFHALPPPTDTEVQDVVEEVACCVRGLLGPDGIGEADALDPCAVDTPLLAACYAGAATQRTALGPRAGRSPPRIGARPGAPFVEHHRNCHARLDGFDLHAAVHVPAHARARLEQLLRYCARPALSHDRLEPFGDGRLRLALKTPWHDGTTHLLLTADELLQRLVALIPRPAKNLLVYHGVLAPNSKWRRRVVLHQRPVPAAADSCHAHLTPAASIDRPHRSNGDWARLMQRAFDIDVLHCPQCGGRMRLLALIQSTHSARRILRHLGLRDHAPPITRAKSSTFDFDDVA